VNLLLAHERKQAIYRKYYKRQDKDAREARKHVNEALREVDQQFHVAWDIYQALSHKKVAVTTGQ